MPHRPLSLLIPFAVLSTRETEGPTRGHSVFGSAVSAADAKLLLASLPASGVGRWTNENVVQFFRGLRLPGAAVIAKTRLYDGQMLADMSTEGVALMFKLKMLQARAPPFPHAHGGKQHAPA